MGRHRRTALRRSSRRRKHRPAARRRPGPRLPQQSIRTFLNAKRPERHSVKLPLSILNTLVWRGLPTERTLAAPAVTTWVHHLRDTDPFLRDECRVILLGEVASVAVGHPCTTRCPRFRTSTRNSSARSGASR
ncbi:IucA/IucC family protein [Streptomyces sp. M19]